MDELGNDVNDNFKKGIRKNVKKKEKKVSFASHQQQHLHDYTNFSFPQAFTCIRVYITCTKVLYEY